MFEYLATLFKLMLMPCLDDKNIFGELPPGGEGLLAKGEKPTFTWKRDGQTFDPEERFKVCRVHSPVPSTK